MANELTKDQFQEVLGTVFAVKITEEKSATLELFELNELKGDPRAEAFSLIFRGDPSEVYIGRTYKVNHATLGEFDLFLNPVGRDQQATIYEAVFNRLRKATNR